MEKYSSLFALCARIFLCLSLFWAAAFNIAGVQVDILSPVAQSMAAPILSATTAAEVVLGVAILIGYKTRHMASLAALYSLTMTSILHGFWNSEPGMQFNDSMNFFQSIGLCGGFLMLVAFGPGEYSADAKLREPAKPETNSEPGPQS